MGRKLEELFVKAERDGTDGRRQGHESEFGVNHNLEIGIESIQHTAAIAKLEQEQTRIERWETRGVGDGEGDADFDEDLVFYEGDSVTE